MAGRVAIEQRDHERRAFGVSDRSSVSGRGRIPWEAADDLPLACLLLQADAALEGQRDGVVLLVQYLVDRLGEDAEGSVWSSPIDFVTEMTRMPSRSRRSCLLARRGRSLGRGRIDRDGDARAERECRFS